MMDKRDIIQLPTASLAYLGDCVIELKVRELLVWGGPHDIHNRALEYVTAVKQSEAFDRISSYLTEDELDVYKRGRNNTHTSPKSATHAQYAKATGFECLFAYLHLAGEADRIDELFKIAYPEK